MEEIKDAVTTDVIVPDKSVGTETPEMDIQAFKERLDETLIEDKAPTLGIKELKALKKSKYHEIVDKFNTIYVIKNKRTGVIVELRGASSFHCCNLIGWRPRHVTVIEEKDAPIENQVEESNDTETKTEKKLA